jgi:uncharacterized protein YecE (DUF72 family)
MLNFLISLKLNATFYEKFYKHIMEIFVATTKAAPDNSQFSVNAPETVTYDRRIDKRYWSNNTLWKS